MFSAFDISTSGMIAQRARLNAISGNLANLSTTRNEAGEASPYQARYAVFQTDDDMKGKHGAAGVRVSAMKISERPPKWKFEPNHPDALTSGPRKGYVAYPDIDMMAEMVSAMNATRAYEANVGVIEATKALGRQTLRILG
jgi:flagellar basal-body rod protein FlgC